MSKKSIDNLFTSISNQIDKLENLTNFKDIIKKNKIITNDISLLSDKIDKLKKIFNFENNENNEINELIEVNNNTYEKYICEIDDFVNTFDDNCDIEELINNYNSINIKINSCEKYLDDKKMEIINL
jgi:DNA repair ATPase RecN